MTTTAERFDVEPQSNGIEDRINRLGIDSYVDASAHPLLRPYEEHELVPAQIHDELIEEGHVHEFGDPVAENEEPTATERQLPQLKSKLANWVVRIAVRIEKNSIKREELGPVHRRVGRTALESVRNGIDRMGMNTPESLEKQGLWVKSAKNYFSEDAKQSRAEVRRERAETKIDNKGVKKSEKAMKKAEKDVRKATKLQNKAQKYEVKALTRHHKPESWTARKLEALDNGNRVQRTRRKLGNVASRAFSGLSGFVYSYSSRNSYSGEHYLKNNENAVPAKTLIDLNQ